MAQNILTLTILSCIDTLSSNLSVPDLLNASVVSKEWRNIFLSDYIWRPLIRSKYRNILSNAFNNFLMRSSPFTHQYKNGNDISTDTLNSLISSASSLLPVKYVKHFQMYYLYMVLSIQNTCINILNKNKKDVQKYTSIFFEGNNWKQLKSYKETLDLCKPFDIRDSHNIYSNTYMCSHCKTNVFISKDCITENTIQIYNASEKLSFCSVECLKSFIEDPANVYCFNCYTLTNEKCKSDTPKSHKLEITTEQLRVINALPFIDIYNDLLDNSFTKEVKLIRLCYRSSLQSFITYKCDEKDNHYLVVYCNIHCFIEHLYTINTTRRGNACNICMRIVDKRIPWLFDPLLIREKWNVCSTNCKRRTTNKRKLSPVKVKQNKGQSKKRRQNNTGTQTGLYKRKEMYIY